MIGLDTGKLSGCHQLLLWAWLYQLSILVVEQAAQYCLMPSGQTVGSAHFQSWNGLRRFGRICAGRESEPGKSPAMVLVLPGQA